LPSPGQRRKPVSRWEARIFLRCTAGEGAWFEIARHNCLSAVFFLVRCANMRLLLLWAATLITLPLAAAEHAFNFG
jgi:hypothetical protein